MNDEQLNKILAKIPTDKVYEDLLQPGLKKVGEALSNVFDLGNLIMLPFKLVNERSRIYLKYNLEQYEKKLASIKEEEFCHVSEQIGLPIVDKLTLINQEELSAIFLNLLTKASCTKTQHLVHPSFLNILNNLSQDEAIILFSLKNCEIIPFIDIYLDIETSSIPKPNENLSKDHNPTNLADLDLILKYQEDLKTSFQRLAYNLTGIEKDIKLYFPQNIDIYLENLERFGIITFVRNFYKTNKERDYENLINIKYQEFIDRYTKYKNRLDKVKEDNVYYEINVKKGYIEFTEFGKAFIDAVIKDINELKLD